MTVTDFSFSEHAQDFDSHISSSIPGYGQLQSTCRELSRRFIQPGTAVIDVGCSSGRLLGSIQEYNRSARPDVVYTGIDCVEDFKVHWLEMQNPSLRFEVIDALLYRGFKNVSTVLSLFTVQFVRSADKMALLQLMYDGLVYGGALIIAEKTLACTARMQDAVTFPYYDYKLRQGHSEKDLLDKERRLRGLMTLWTEDELKEILRKVGFREIQSIWSNFTFVGYLALK